MLRGHFTGALIYLYLQPTASPMRDLQVPTHLGQMPSNLLTVEQGARLEHAPLSQAPPRRRACLSQTRGAPPYLRRLLIGSWGAARAPSDRSAAWAGRVLHLPS